MKLRKLITPDEDYAINATNRTTVKDIDNIMTQESSIRRLIKTVKFLARYAKMYDILIMLVKDWRKGIYTQVPLFTIAAIGAALFYLLSPFDLMPDFIPGIGYIDDMTMLTLVIGWIDTDLHKYLDWKLNSEDGPHNMTLKEGMGSQAEIEREAAGE
jgi:uncharacterized membrane protein YkvA (DUF1232 family)